VLGPESFRGPFAHYFTLMLPAILCFAVSNYCIGPAFQIAHRTLPLIAGGVAAVAANAFAVLLLPATADASAIALAQSISSAAGLGVTQEVLIRITPDVSGETHAAISTGQANSKFGFGLADAEAAIERIAESAHLRLVGLHCHIGSQLLTLEPFTRAVEALAALGDFDVYNFGGGLGVAYRAEQEPPSIADYVATLVSAANSALGAGKRLLIEPGRSLVANSTVTLYTVETVKRNVSTWVAVDGGMSDNLRPMLYGSKYEVAVASRMLAGKHCESGDVIARDVLIDDPRPGDIIVTPATGAYGYAMANNYNGVTRAPVIFCKDGEARVVVRRESYEDLMRRDVE